MNCIKPHAQVLVHLFNCAFDVCVTCCPCLALKRNWIKPAKNTLSNWKCILNMKIMWISTKLNEKWWKWNFSFKFERITVILKNAGRWRINHSARCHCLLFVTCPIWQTKKSDKKTSVKNENTLAALLNGHTDTMLPIKKVREKNGEGNKVRLKQHWALSMVYSHRLFKRSEITTEKKIFTSYSYPCTRVCIVICMTQLLQWRACVQVRHVNSYWLMRKGSRSYWPITAVLMKTRLPLMNAVVLARENVNELVLAFLICQKI